MRVCFGIVACLLALWGPAAADDEARPLDPEQAADRVLELYAANDVPGLAALAAEDEPDPWLVADELCFRGEHGAAAAFAEAAPRLAVEGLPAYVASLVDTEPNTAQRKMLDEMNAATRVSDWERALDILGPGVDPLPPVMVVVRMACGRASSLAGLHRYEEASDAFTAAAGTSERMGWLTKAAAVHGYAAYMAWRGAAYHKSLAALERSRGVRQRLGDKLGVARSLGSRGLVLFDLGEHDQALMAYEQALEMQEALGDAVGATKTRGNMGSVYKMRAEYPAALALFERALKEYEAQGDRSGAAGVRNNIGTVHMSTGAHAEALAMLEQAYATQLSLGEQRAAASTLSNIAIVHDTRGDYVQAIATYEEVITTQEALGDTLGAARTRGNLGTVHVSLGNYATAQALMEQAHAAQVAIGNQVGAATTIQNLGLIQFRLGDFTRALGTFQRALEAQHALGNQAEAAIALGNVGATYKALGDYARALTTHEQARAAHDAIGNQAGVAAALANIGSLYDDFGDHAQALVTLQKAHSVYEALGQRAGAALVLGNMGIVHLALDDPATALTILQRALAEKEALGDRSGAAMTLSTIAAVHARAGESATALATQERVLSANEALGNKAGMAGALRFIGELQLYLGRPDEGRASLERSVRMATSMRAVPLLVSALKSLAYLHLRTGDTGRALGRAREARREVEGMLGSLGEEEGSTARGKQMNLFAIGTRAAAREGDLAEALTFLESGRAGALLDALGKREVLRWKAEALPEALRRADQQANEALNLARHRYERAREASSRKQLKRARRALDEATEGVRAVTARIQRDVKRQAGLYYPRAETIEDIQAALAPDQALVVYGLCLDEALAIVLRRGSARLVELGSSRDILVACEALDASDATIDATAALADVKRALVAPLELAPDVGTVLVSPEGRLGYVPFGAVFDQAVAMTPSGTTHVLLKGDQRGRGTQVLALGDPDYGVQADPGALAIYRRGGGLSPLPASRDEAMNVGDVVLLGPKASEPALAEALTRQAHWRAVHLACHGLVKPENPMLSSLALTRVGDYDGFLTCSEVLRMQVPADLVVLSACETATGKIVRGEGIVGLTRAFMYAGTPRVLCSLWKVDDAATRALMEKFYELWNPRALPAAPPKRTSGLDAAPRLGAAEALQQAQAFLRSHEKWKHPYYWASWVLWGLPN